jgi:hypothetical protein
MRVFGHDSFGFLLAYDRVPKPMLEHNPAILKLYTLYGEGTGIIRRHS